MRLFKKLCGKIKGAFRRMKSKFDCMGSYTGTAENKTQDERPEQDADDL